MFRSFRQEHLPQVGDYPTLINQVQPCIVLQVNQGQLGGLT